MARRLFTIALVLFACAALPCLAWSKLGHQLVAELAWRHLEPDVQTQIQQLLAGEPDPTLAGVANWADELRNSDPARFKHTSKWHYINAKGGGCGFDLARDCPDGACVVGAVQDQLAILRDPQRPLDARRDALKFIVHLVGDLHQPMHAGDRDDAGGNGYQISLRTDLAPEAYARKNYADGIMGTNLHAVWDYYVLGEAGLTLDTYADRLDTLPWPPRPVTMSPPMNWARESCQLIASRQLYPAGHKMDDRYPQAMRPLAEQRIRQAAWRLADMLNQALGQPSSGPAQPR